MLRIWFRPRILRNVTNVDWSTKILGHATKMPIYIVSSLSDRACLYFSADSTQTATALGKLGHPDGELNLTRAAAKHNVIQMVRHLYMVYVQINPYPYLHRSRPWPHVHSTRSSTMRHPVRSSFFSCTSTRTGKLRRNSFSTRRSAGLRACSSLSMPLNLVAARRQVVSQPVL